MKNKEPDSDLASRAHLRRKAEEAYEQKKQAIPASISDVEAYKLLHELQVHQIELEMQNESMRQLMEKAEHAAKQYGDLYEEIYDYSPSGYFTLDRSGVIHKLNLSGALLLERERMHVIGSRFQEFVKNGEEAVFREFLRKIFETRKMASCEIRLSLLGRPAKVLHLESRKAEDESMCLVTAVDITEHVEIEHELRELNRQVQKDAVIKAELLNEVNHRVKNNLMMIVGLLLAEKQHAIAQKKEEIALTYEKIELHIKGLLKVHQMLSDGRWNPMRISDLAHQICSIVLNNSDVPKAVALHIAESPIEILPRQANNLALILNELTVNALKYAFRRSSKPVISIEISQEEDKAILKFRDNGSGFPSKVIKNGSPGVGLRLIRQLIGDLPGNTIDIRNDHGAVVMMRFSLNG